MDAMITAPSPSARIPADALPQDAVNRDGAAKDGASRDGAGGPGPARLNLTHEPGPRGGQWAVCDDGGERHYSVGRRPFGGTRTGVRDREGVEQASLGERVLSLVENYTIWRGGRPYARVYRPARGLRDRWFVEVGDDDGWVVLTDGAGLRVFRGGVQVARVGERDARGLPSRVDLELDTDASLVLALAALLHTLEEPVV